MPNQNGAKLKGLSKSKIMKFKQFMTFGLFAFIGPALYAQQKAEIRIQKEVDGKVQEITKELEIEEGQDISELLESLGLLNEMGELKAGEKFEIILRRSNDSELLSEHDLFFEPNEAELFENDDRGFLGVILRETNMEGNTGALISEVMDGTAAEKAGVEPGDIILELEGDTVDNVSDAVNLISSYAPGEDVSLMILRNGEEIELIVQLGEREKKAHWSRPFEATPLPYNSDFENDFWEYNGMEPKAFLGITKGQEQNAGVQVGSVVEASSAEEMGLKEGDLILEINKEELGSFTELAELITSMNPGDEIELRIERDGKKKTLVGELGQSEPSPAKMNMKRFRGCDEDGSYLFDFEMPEFEERIEGLLDQLEDQLSEEQLENIMNRLEDSGQKAQELFENKFQNRYNETSITIELLPLSENELDDIARQLELEEENIDGLKVDKIEIYPNPTNSSLRFSILLNSIGQVDLLVLDTSGHQVYAESLDHQGGRIVRSIDLSQETNGTYFLVIKQEDQVFTKKIIKQ